MLLMNIADYDKHHNGGNEMICDLMIKACFESTYLWQPTQNNYKLLKIGIFWGCSHHLIACIRDGRISMLHVKGNSKTKSKARTSHLKL